VRAVFASRNHHKLEQIRELLPGFELIPVDDVAPQLVLHEPFATFEANAVAKARAAMEATGMPAVADDSGLEVDALGGEPGVRSSRYAGETATDKENNRLLVYRLTNVPAQELTCHYTCVAAIAFPDGRTVTARGYCDGRLELYGRGTMGFGYDPHFVPEGDTRTMAEIPMEEKLTFSHRGHAFRNLARRLRELDGG
jgi:XTP/dITP diphosphohydrolase